jgi:nucleotide-binding universal stress UspA family protein
VVDEAVPFIRQVVQPMDFSDEGEQAFAHALAIALIREARLILLHAGREYLGEDEWAKFPPIRRTLERWGLLDPGSPRSAISGKLGLRVEKVNVRGVTALGAILEYLEEHPADLLVVATDQRDGLPRFLHPSIAERLARRSQTKTLFVPKHGRGFVLPEDGTLRLRRILIPVDREPSPHEALVYGARAAEALGDPPVAITLLHVGERDAVEVETPRSDACTWDFALGRGDVADEILRVANEREVDLIALATRGHDGVLDALRGSVTEQVVRRAPCPVLAVPAL